MGIIFSGLFHDIKEKKDTFTHSCDSIVDEFKIGESSNFLTPMWA